jgi:hypothetical protein
MITELMTERQPIHQMLQLGKPPNIGSAFSLIALCKLGSEPPHDGLRACPSLKLLLITVVAKLDILQCCQGAL